MIKIEEIIIDKRPNLSKSSIATYKSILKSIHKASFDDKDIDIKDFDKTKEILKALDEKPITTRKTILSALFVITDNDIYRKKMLEDITDYNKEIGKQEKTEKQKDNWIEKEDISKLKNSMDKIDINLNWAKALGVACVFLLIKTAFYQ